MRRRANIAVAVGLVLVTAIPTGCGSESEDEKFAAIAALEKLGGTVEVEPELVADLSDAGLAHLEGLDNLEELRFYSTNVTEAGLVHLKGLTKLEWLNLIGTQITDEGLAHLEGLTDLKILELKNTKVTDAGVKKFKAAFPRCYIGR
jgi:Leucine-rich repeat (LRR) protein